MGRLNFSSMSCWPEAVEKLVLSNILLKEELLRKGRILPRVNTFVQHLTITLYSLFICPLQLNSVLFDWIREATFFYSLADNLLLLVLSVALLALLFLSCLLLHHRLSHLESLSRNRLKHQRIVSKVTGYLGLLLDFILVPWVATVLVLTHAPYSESAEPALRTLSLAIPLGLVQLSRMRSILFGQGFLLLLGGSLVASEVQYILVVVLASYWLLGEFSRFMQAIYAQLIWIHLMLLVVALTAQQISTASIIAISLFVALGVALWPRSLNLAEVSQRQENEILLRHAGALERAKELNSFQEKEVKCIAHNFKKHHEKASGARRMCESIRRLTSNVSSKRLLQFVRLKVELGLREKAGEIGLRLQRYEALLMGETFSLQLVPGIYALSREVWATGSFEEKLRAEGLLRRVTARHLSCEDSVDAAVMVGFERRKEAFYFSFMALTEKVLSFWGLLERGRVAQRDLEAELRAMVVLEEQCRASIAQLRPLRSVELEEELFDYVMKSISLSYRPLRVEKERGARREDLVHDNSNYVLVRAGRVEALSYQVANELMFAPGDLVDRPFGELVAGPLAEHFADCENRLLGASESRQASALPLETRGSGEQFLPFMVRFRLLPSLERGLSFTMSFVEEQSLRKYPSFLYSLNREEVVGYSGNFCDYFRIEEEVALRKDHWIGEVFSMDLTALCQPENAATKEFHCNTYLRRLFTVRGMATLDIAREIPVTLIRQEVYQLQRDTVCLIEIRNRDEGVALETSHQVLEAYIRETGVEESSQERSGMGTSRNSGDQTFCRIINPLVPLIEEKCDLRGSFFSLTFMRVVSFFLLLMVLCLGVMLYLGYAGVHALTREMETELATEFGRSLQVKTIYLLYFQYYEYYLMEHYPQHVLQAHPYNVTLLYNNYRALAAANVDDVLNYQLEDTTPMSTDLFQLYYDHFNVSMPVERLSLLDIATDVRQAIGTDDPAFMVRNEKAIEPILHAYVGKGTQSVAEQFDESMLMLGVALGAVGLLILVVKVLSTRLEYMLMRMYSLYSLVLNEHIQHVTSRVQDLIGVLKLTKYYLAKTNRDLDRLEEAVPTSRTLNLKRSRPPPTRLTQEQMARDHKDADEADGLSHNESFERQERRMKLVRPARLEKSRGVVRKGMVEVLGQHNLIFMVVGALAVYFAVFYLKMDSYKSESLEILDYLARMETSMEATYEIAQSYMQEAMEEILPASQRSTESFPNARVIHSIDPNNLPAYFDSLKAYQNELLDRDLCSFAPEVMAAPLYAPLNCSLMMHGALTKGIAEAYTIYSNTLATYVNTPISRIGTQLRPNGTYPVFIELFYSRHLMAELLLRVENRFLSEVDGYNAQKERTLKAYILAGIAIAPLVVALMLLYTRRLVELCKTGLKCFLIMPKKLVFSIATAKHIKRSRALETIDWMSIGTG